MRRFTFFVALALVAGLAVPAAARPNLASGGDTSPWFVPADVSEFHGQLARALRAEGLDAAQIDEVATAVEDARALVSQLPPPSICDFACGVSCPVRWSYTQILVDVVRRWQRGQLCQGWTACGTLYDCSYRFLVEERTLLNLCHCDPDPDVIYDDYGCYWFTGMSMIRECTEPVCRPLGIVEEVDAADITDARPSLGVAAPK